jgi:hypothetical protein
VIHIACLSLLEFVCNDYSMSKADFYSGDADRIPSYEEAVSTASDLSLSTARSTTSSIRQERTRRVLKLVREEIVSCFATHVSNLCHHVTIVVIPPNAICTKVALTSQNVVSPALPTHRTNANVIQLSDTDYQPSFWTQAAVVQELDQILRKELSASEPAVTPQMTEPKHEKTQSSLLPPLQVQPSPSAQLPARPAKQSWLKRTFVLPGEDHDPTGETGKWNLGWRSPEGSQPQESQSGWMAAAARPASGLMPDEVAVQTLLRDVSFRVENEMGLLETSTVKCIWVEIEVGV